MYFFCLASFISHNYFIHVAFINSLLLLIGPYSVVWVTSVCLFTQSVGMFGWFLVFGLYK